MALSKKISQFRLTVNSTDYDFDLQNQEIGFSEEYFSGEQSKLALSGKKITRFAGYRMKADINFQSNLEPTSYRNFFDDMYTHFVTNGNNSMVFRPEASVATTIDVVLTGASYRAVYNNQIGQFIPSLSIESEDRLSIIPSGFEAP